MAYNKADCLQKVALDGFTIIEERFGRGSSQGQYQRRRHHHHEKPAPNQYCYQEPDEPSFRANRPPKYTKQRYETWYFLPVPQAPKREGAVISSSQAAKTMVGYRLRIMAPKMKLIIGVIIRINFVALADSNFSLAF
ncbi:hypothetical protein CXB51_025475 [Gossypium anomalum]|uniref:Uncharacterized protein n=1 Tax=Gossypium anomalum TaxID=47600 RepID=A0A8J6CQG9_9ROSI|nr:hypothetical protein CXB51_025475 [Gossypium anomalum]